MKLHVPGQLFIVEMLGGSGLGVPLYSDMGTLVARVPTRSTVLCITSEKLYDTFGFGSYDATLCLTSVGIGWIIHPDVSEVIT